MNRIVPILLLLLTSCASVKPHSAKPDLSAAISHNQSVIDSLTSSQQDSAAIRKAISALQASNIALHKLSADMTGNLDRADYKTAILLK